MKPLPSILAFMNRPWLVAGLLGLVTAVVFLPAVSYDFVNWDDGPYVYENPLVRGGLSAAGVRGACTDVVVCCWAPLTMLSFQLDSTLFGTEAAGYHLTNVLLHAAAVATLYVALVRMTAAPGRTAAAMLLFAIHPLRVESVAWIAERKDVLSVLLLGVTLITYEAYCRSPCVTRYLVVCAAMVAGLLAKATLVTLPALLLLLDCWPLGRLAIPGLGPGALGDGATARYPQRPWNAVLAEKLPLLAVADQRQIATWKDSGTLWTRVIDLDPDNCLALYHYGLYLHFSDNLPAAIAQFQRTVQAMEAMNLSAHKRSAAHDALGVVLRDADRQTEAAAHFHLAASLDPTNYRARTNIGLMQLNGGSPDKAVEQFQMILSARPHDPDALHNLVIAHALRGDLPAAIIACRRLVAERPTTAEPRSRLGQLLFKNGQLEDAIEEFRTVRRIDPQYPGILNLLNQAIEEQSRRNAAPEHSPP